MHLDLLQSLHWSATAVWCPRPPRSVHSKDVPSRHAVEDDQGVFLNGIVEVGLTGPEVHLEPMCWKRRLHRSYSQKRLRVEFSRYSPSARRRHNSVVSARFDVWVANEVIVGPLWMPNWVSSGAATPWVCIEWLPVKRSSL